MEPVQINAAMIRRLDLSPLQVWSSRPLAELLELAECPEPRLWALRADARFPWLPLLLERDRGSLIRHVAMVVPHSFSRSEGLRFEPQALELWITHRMMQLDDLCSSTLGRSMRGNLSQMAAALGYELDENFWNLLN